MIDWDRVGQLREEVGEDDFQDVVAMFFDEVSGEIDALSPNMSHQELEASLHFLKGSALNLGLEQFAEICRKGEERARKGQSDQVDTSAIAACYRESVEAFFKVLSGTAAA